jgi:cupin fold WbuC family metalloprotein
MADTLYTSAQSPYPMALPHVTGDAFRLSPEVLAQGVAASAANPRKRMILPLHRTQEASVGRMLNFFQPGTFVRPHLHPVDFASETILVIRGALGVVIFDESGGVTASHLLRADGLGLIDIEAGVWHGMTVLEPDTVVLEIKRGPYEVRTDKVFAPWAPVEGSEQAVAYERQLRASFDGAA